MSFGFELVSLMALSTNSRCASLILFTTLFLTIFYNTQSDLSHELSLNCVKHISVTFLKEYHRWSTSPCHFGYDALWWARLSTTVMNIKWKDVHILLMSGSDLREFQSTELRLLKKSISSSLFWSLYILYVNMVKWWNSFEFLKLKYYQDSKICASSIAIRVTISWYNLAVSYTHLTLPTICSV